MRLGILLLLAMGACAKQAPVAPTNADIADCQGVYQHVLVMKVKEIDPKISLDPRWQSNAMQAIDHTWNYSGIKDRFMQACYPHMSKAQIDCALKTEQITDINTCIKFVQ